MKITYIKLFNKNNEKVLMKHLRERENPRELNFYMKDIGQNISNKISNHHKRQVETDDISKSNVVLYKFYNKFKKSFGKDGFSKKLVKKNQVILVATALMLVTAGYLNYTNNIKMAVLGDAQLVSTNVSTNEQLLEEENSQVDDEVIETSINNEELGRLEEKKQEESNEQLELGSEQLENSDTQNLQENTLETATKTNDNEYFTKTKLEREKMYSQMLETYQKIMENSSIPNDQKSIASNEIKNINDKKNAIATIENLIKIKGFEDVAILVNDNSINIVVKSPNNLETTQVAQIQNIISRELKSDIEDIHITTHQ